MISPELEAILKEKFPNAYNQIGDATRCWKAREISQEVFLRKLKLVVAVLNEVILELEE